MVTIAPALTIGLNGRLISSTATALKAFPDGSTPTWRITASRPRSSSAMPNTNGLEIDWIVNCCRESPTSKTWPSLVTTLTPNQSGSALPELWDVRGDVAGIEGLQLLEQVLELVEHRRRDGRARTRDLQLAQHAAPLPRRLSAHPHLIRHRDADVAVAPRSGAGYGMLSGS